jgi:glutamyl/glutaminyl-tRNA synthetase
VRFEDLRLGRQEQVPATQCGDVLVRDRFGHWTYQFGVVVDDRDQQVDVVIRGEDLLSSTGRQVLLGELLGRAAPPQYLHHPLLRHADGRKLSKAASDTSLRELRDGGATAATLIGEAAAQCGLIAQPRPIDAANVAALFAS